MDCGAANGGKIMELPSKARVSVRSIRDLWYSRKRIFLRLQNSDELLLIDSFRMHDVRQEVYARGKGGGVWVVSVGSKFMAEFKCSITPIIRTLVVRLANYPDRLGPSGKHFLTVIVLHLFMA